MNPIFEPINDLKMDLVENKVKQIYILVDSNNQPIRSVNSDIKQQLNSYGIEYSNFEDSYVMTFKTAYKKHGLFGGSNYDPKYLVRA